MKFEVGFVLENASWPALLVDQSGQIVHANASAASLFGLPAEGKVLLSASIWPPENPSTVEAFLSQTARAAMSSAPLKLRIKGGSIGVFQSSVCALTGNGQQLFLVQLFNPDAPAPVAAPSGILSKLPLPLPAPPIANTLESGLAHKQKLDCALQLIRTVALDFNNALTSVLGHTSLILSKTEPNHVWRASLLEIEKSAEKAAEIAADLAAFSRQEKDTTTQAAGNLNDLVRRAVGVFQTAANESVVWGMQLESKLYSAVFDEAKMQQALMKILENAVQALNNGGHIIVRTRNCDFKAPHQDGATKLEAGSFVCVEFEDNGSGISIDVLPRIFEPFFTTKDRSKHRGLGLAWVYGIITNHGGSVAVSSEPGLGTSVRVYLPALNRIVRDRNVSTDDLTGSETILMIDDEDLLLTMGQTILSAYGYRVLTANGGVKALEIFAKESDKIDLVITDLVMPQMGGREVIERLRKTSPNIRVIYSSGYVRALNSEEQHTYLQKPFTSQDLLRKVKQVLAPAGAAH